MFDADAGFFNLLFANLEDDYYTEPCIKMNLLSFLRLKLIEDGFRYLCFIEKTPFGHKREYRITMAGGLEISMLQQTPKHVGFFGKLFGAGEGSSDSCEVNNKSDVEVSGKTLREYLDNLLNKMSGKKRIAVVCPIDVFAECCEDEELMKSLVLRQKSPNHNTMIITSSVDAADNDKYFKYLAVESSDMDTTVFRDFKLFPNIETCLKRGKNLTKLIFTYDFLKEAFKGRMKLLNDLSYEKLCLVMSYSITHGNQLRLVYPSEYYAAVVYAWYESEDFRRRYTSLDLPENPFSETRIIADAVSRPDFLRVANKVIEAELEVVENDEAEAIADFWRTDEGGVNIVYDESTLDERSPEIYGFLITFRRLLKGREDILEESEAAEIDMLINHFSRPSYPLHGNETVMPHEWASEYRQQLNELFQSLKKEYWNSWDETAMRLMYVLFKRCYEHTRETDDSTQDVYNYLGELEFKKCVEAVGYCVKNSDKYPSDSVRANYFYNETKRVLCCEDPRSVKTYRIGD